MGSSCPILLRNFLRGLFVLFGLVVLADSAWPQQKPSNWRVYKMADGLPEPACNSVTLTWRGKVLAGHPNRLFVSELDGYNVRMIPLSERNRHVWESPGGQLWTANSKGLLEFREGTWLLHPVREIAAHYRTNSSAIIEIALCPVRQGQVIFLLPDQLLEFRVDESPQVRVLRAASDTSLESFTSLVLARNSGLWVVGKRGLLKFPGPARSVRERKDWRELVPDAGLGLTNLRELREYSDGVVTLLADSAQPAEKLLVEFDGQKWTPHVLAVENVRSAWRGPDKSWWAITPTSLLHWDVHSGTAVENEEVSARAYYDVSVESSGAFWLATSDGLYRYAPGLWRQPPALRNIESLIHGLTADKDERLWFISGSSLHAF